MRVVSACLAILAVMHLGIAASARGENPPSAVGSMLKLLQSGRVPEDRLGTIVKLVCTRGNEHDLQYVFSRVMEPDGWPLELQRDALEWLHEAGRTRKVVPAGDLAGLTGLLASEDRAMRAAAVDLAGLWKVAAAAPELERIIKNADEPAALRQGAVASLAAFAPDRAGELLTGLSRPDQPFATRSFAVVVLSSLDVRNAAGVAARIMGDAGERDDPAPILDAFLDLQQGSDVLAAALRESPPTADIAKLALRHMYSVGRTDAELSKVLSSIAGISQDPAPPTPEEIAAVVRAAVEQGDAARGEVVFRRNDLSCMKCHAVSAAGGQIGPDLSAIGSSSPLDYLARAVLDPDADIKEAYTTKVVLTVQGRIYQGIVADRTADALILRDANGNLTSIPLDDIDDEIEGKSLMPKGLVKFMTQAELIDLIKFLSVLGKPGDYQVRATQRMQRWRLLTNAPEELVREIPGFSSFEDLVLRSGVWEAAYARVNGDLPLEEVSTKTGEEVVYVQGEVRVTRPGPVGVTIDSPDGVHAWIGDQEIGSKREFTVALPVGTHPITLRIDTGKRASAVIKLELTRPEASKAEFAVVDGQ